MAETLITLSSLKHYDGKIKEYIDNTHIELTQAEYDALSEEEKMNGITYFITDVEGTEGDVGHIELTQAEYDALSEEEKMNGVVYFITDAENDSSEKEVINCIKSITLENNGLKTTDVEGNENIVVPLAKRNQLGLVTTTSYSTEVKPHHVPCPVIDGVPYYEKTIYSGMLTLNGDTVDECSYVKNTENDTVTITLYLRENLPYRTVFNIYLHQTNNQGSASAPWSFTHLTAFSGILAYPSQSSWYGWINNSKSISGASVLEEGKYTLTGQGSSTGTSHLIITIQGASNWHNSLFYKIVAE